MNADAARIDLLCDLSIELTGSLVFGPVPHLTFSVKNKQDQQDTETQHTLRV